MPHLNDVTIVFSASLGVYFSLCSLDASVTYDIAIYIYTKYMYRAKYSVLTSWASTRNYIFDICITHFLASMYTNI